MKKILYFVAALAAASFITTTGTSCKFAPDQHDGDTVAASEFYPIDTSAAHAKKMAKIAAIKNGISCPAYGPCGAPGSLTGKIWRATEPGCGSTSGQPPNCWSRPPP